MRKLAPLLTLFIGFSVFSQTEFFNSKINFSDEHLSNFYSSFIIDSTQVYFSANDYKVHAYDKKSGAQNWSYYAATKSNAAPKLYKDNIFVKKHITENHNQCVQLNSKTGDTIQTLSITSINTTPVFNNDIMYCTAIEYGTGGNIMAYDLKKNAVVWQKFIAHGVDMQPYFLKDKIIANAEADNWFELDYNGNLLDTTCRKKTDLFVPDIKCVRNFRYLTHNQKELSDKYFDDFKGIKLKYVKDKTIVLGDDKLLVISNKNKIEKEIRLEAGLEFSEAQETFYKEILKAEENIVWYLHKNTLAIYDFKNDRTLQKYDLGKWNAHKAILDDKNLWLISRNDGQLYGLKLE